MENNRTVQILRKAHNEGYGVVAQVRTRVLFVWICVCSLALVQVIYDYGMAVTTVRGELGLVVVMSRSAHTAWSQLLSAPNLLLFVSLLLSFQKVSPT